MADFEPYTYEKEQARSIALAKGLRRIADIVSTLSELDGHIKVLRDEAKNVEDGRFTIVVLGAFNRGKSTLLNAMVGRELLPMAAVPSTAIITLLRYSPVEQIIVHFKDSRPADPCNVEEFREKYILPVVAEIDARVAAGSDEDADEAELEQGRLRVARDLFSHIDYAEVGFPCDLFENGVEFVDSPGFEDDDARTDRAKKFLDKSHAVLFLLDATQAVTAKDTETLDWVQSRGKRAIFFALNKWNFLELMERTLAGRANVEKRFRSRLAKYTTVDGVDRYEERAFKINALGALDARLAAPPDAAMLDKSSVPVLERTLERFLVEERVEARDNALLSKAENLQSEFNKFVKLRLRLLNTKLDRLIATRGKLEPKLKQLRGIRGHIETFLDGRKVDVQKRLADSLSQHMGGLNTEQIVREKLKLDIIEEGWLAGKVMWNKAKDLARKPGEWLGLLEDSDKHRFEVQVLASLQPQLEKLFKEELKSWQEGEAKLVMQTEGQKMTAYLKREAADFQRILQEIGVILEDESQGPRTIDEQVKEWLARSIAGQSGPMIGIGEGELTIDLAPILATIAAEIAVHFKATLLPVVGTIISILWSLWRQNQNVETMKQGIIKSLKEALEKVPNAEQRRQIDVDVEKSFADLKDTVLTNINLKIASLQKSLDNAIAAVERRNVNIDNERKRLMAMQNAADKELAELKKFCVAS